MPDDGSYVAAGTGIASGRTESDLTGDLIVFGRDGQRLWSRRSTRGVHRVQTTADGSMIVAHIGDQIQAFSPLGELLWKHEMPARPWLVGVSSDGGLVVSGSLHRVDVLDRSGNLRWSQEPAGTIEAVAVPRSGGFVAVTFWDWIDPQRKSGATASGTVAVFEASGNLRWSQRVSLVATCEDDVHLPTAVSQDGSVIALGSAALEGRLFAFRSDGALLWRDPAPDDILETCVSPDGALVALGSSDFRLHVFDGPKGNAWTHSTGGDEQHMAADFALAVSSQGALVAAASGDENIYLFDRTGNEIAREPMGARPQSIRFSTNGALLVAGSTEGTIRALAIR